MTASARRQAAWPFLRPPYDRCTAEALLEHYRTRTGVRAFAVADPEATRRDRIDALCEGRFELNGETHVLPDPPQWLVNPGRDVEWHILLHKFYYAVGLAIAFRDTGDARYARRWHELIDSWIDQTPPGFIAPDVTGRRVQNWLWSFHLLVTGGAPLLASFVPRFLASIAEQVRYLAAHLAPARNHRTLELHAIFLAGVVLPELAEAAHWRRFALEELARNVATDLRPDGVQCEQSTDYHHIVLRNLLGARWLAHVNGIEVPEAMDAGIRRALDFALHAHKPDGGVPAFSDGDARPHRDVLEAGHALYGRADLLYAATAGRRGTPPAARTAAFPAAGYYVMRSGWGERETYADERYLMYDCGPIGDGNHGHLDVHSIEVAAYGRSLVVDPGRYTYDSTGETDWRRAFRSTAAHNTVVVDGREQARCSPPPRRSRVVGPGPECAVPLFASGEGCDVVHGVARSHEYDAVHERCIWFVGGAFWIVTDLLLAREPHRYTLRFHLDPLAHGRCALARGDGRARVVAPNLVVAQPAPSDTDVAIDEGWFAPRYGIRHAVPVVRSDRTAATTAFHTVLYPFRSEPPDVEVEIVDVTAGDGAFAARLRVAHEGASATYVALVAAFGVRDTWRFAGWRYDGAHLLLRLDDSGDARVLYADPGATLAHEDAR
jgi:uncharacterized heparinase superfamily protein